MKPISCRQGFIAVYPLTFDLPGGGVISSGCGVCRPANTNDLAYDGGLGEKVGFRVVRQKDLSRTFFLELALKHDENARRLDPGNSEWQKALVQLRN